MLEARLRWLPILFSLAVFPLSSCVAPSISTHTGRVCCRHKQGNIRLRGGADGTFSFPERRVPGGAKSWQASQGHARGLDRPFASAPPLRPGPDIVSKKLEISPWLELLTRIFNTRAKPAVFPVELCGWWGRLNEAAWAAGDDGGGRGATTRRRGQGPLGDRERGRTIQRRAGAPMTPSYTRWAAQGGVRWGLP